MTPQFLAALRDYIHRVARVPVGVEFDHDWQKVLDAVPKPVTLEHPLPSTQGGQTVSIKYPEVTYNPPPIIPFPETNKET
jgi:hypothetical protein